LGAEYDIVATSYESQRALKAKGFVVPKSKAGFRVVTRVDARDLARHFGPNEFDLIIFNNPRAAKGWQKETGDLIEGVLQSAPDVLRAGGEVRFGVVRGRNAPGVYRLRDIARPGEYRSFLVDVMPFSSDMFGAAYTPLRTGGVPIGVGVDAMDWYRFVLSP
jgi:hypothetical protein